jgi:hypothetical protein
VVCVQSAQTIFSLGLDGGVKTIYSPAPAFSAPHFFESLTVKSRLVIATRQAFQGRFTFVFVNLLMSANAAGLAMLPLDRHEARLHPEEGSA